MGKEGRTTDRGSYVHRSSTESRTVLGPSKRPDPASYPRKMIRFTVFDLGQVLSSPPDLYRAPAELLGFEPVAFQALYWTGRPAYDAGGSRVEYWQPMVEQLGVQPTGELISALATMDAELWIQLRPTAIEVLQAVHRWGLRTGLLSNAPLALGRAVRHSDWAPLIDRVFISAELRLIKPDPAIYAAATEFGWQAHLWVDDADSLAWLTEVCER